MVLVNTPVGENEDVHALAVMSVSLHEETVDSLFHGCILIIYNRKNRYLKALLIHVLNL